MILHTLHISVNFVSLNLNVFMDSIVRKTKAAACAKSSNVCSNLSGNAALIRVKLKCIHINMEPFQSIVCHIAGNPQYKLNLWCSLQNSLSVKYTNNISKHMSTVSSLCPQFYFQHPVKSLTYFRLLVT